MLFLILLVAALVIVSSPYICHPANSLQVCPTERQLLLLTVLSCFDSHLHLLLPFSRQMPTMRGQKVHDLLFLLSFLL